MMFNSSTWRNNYFFFFQAEDGIRDLTVTGVQTCALPICQAAARPRARRSGARVIRRRAQAARRDDGADARAHRAGGRDAVNSFVIAKTDRKSVVEGKRVDLGGRRIIKKKKKKRCMKMDGV